MRGQGVRRHQGQGVAPDILRPLQGQLMERHRLQQGQLFHLDESMVKANCHFDFSPLLLFAFLRAGEDERGEKMNRQLISGFNMSVMGLVNCEQAI